jgi:opacity protein-like surface antigen
MYLGTLTGGYRVIDSAEGTLDAMGGLRVMSVNTTFDASGGLIPGFAVHSGDTWVNPIAALRGKVALGQGFFLSGYGDIGAGGDNDFTWQMYGGAGYMINPEFSAYLGYRYLEMRHDDHNLTLNLDEQGPLLGVSYRF